MPATPRNVIGAIAGAKEMNQTLFLFLSIEDNKKNPYLTTKSEVKTEAHK